MASTNFVVTSLPDYVQANRDVILKNFALVGAGTRAHMAIQTGVKKSAHLNFLDLAPALQSGEECEFTPSGTATLTQREIETALIKVDLDICPRHLVGKYAEYLVRINATENELPFEQYIIDGVVAEINKKIEKLIWQGDTSSADVNLKWIDGLLVQLAADSDVLTESIASGATAYAGILQVYMAIPEEAIERGAEIYVSPAIYRTFVQNMIAQNYYHYSGPQDAYPDEFVLPGTNARVVKAPGLAGSLKIVGTFRGNLVYGCDMEGDAEDIDLWFSRDDRVFKLEALWNSGVSYYFPDQIVLGTFAATPALA